jgi:hypothetical protein
LPGGIKNGHGRGEKMPRFQFKLRSLFWLMTAVAAACVAAPASPLVASRFLADTRRWLVTVALAIFVALAVTRKRTWS